LKKKPREWNEQVEKIKQMEKIINEIQYQKMLEPMEEAKFVNLDLNNYRINPNISIKQTLVKSELTE
jgi:hypothetical protein